MQQIRDAYERATRRLLILDYDGTLVPLAKRPQQAAPPNRLVDLLSALAADARNWVALISGRSIENLAWCHVEVSIGRCVGTLSATAANGLEIYGHTDFGALCGPYAGQLCGRKTIFTGLALSYGRTGVRRVAGQ